LQRIALEPILDDIMVELLAPEEAGIGLARDAGFVFAKALGQALGVEFVCLPNPIAE
jgi:hypothetical protein